MKALLVWAYCLSCNSSTLSVTKFDSPYECSIAKEALIASAKVPGFIGMRGAFENSHAPQCIEYFFP